MALTPHTSVLVASCGTLSSSPLLNSSPQLRCQAWKGRTIPRSHGVSWQNRGEFWQKVIRRGRRTSCVRVSNGGHSDKENGEEGDVSEKQKESVQIEVAPAVMKILEKGERKKVAGGGGESGGGLSLIERNLKKRKEASGKKEEKKEDDEAEIPNIIPLSFDADARMDEGRYDGAFYPPLDAEASETLEINTLDDFYPALVILLTDALLELGDLMKMFGDGAFFSIQAMSRASRLPGQRVTPLKSFPEDSQLRKSLENILVNVQALSFYISSLFCGLDGRVVNSEELLDTEADLLYTMYYKYKHRQTISFPLDETELLEQVVKKTSFQVSGTAALCRQGLIFPGEFTSAPYNTRDEIQKLLDAKFEGLVAILLQQGVLIAHRNELLSFSLPERGDLILSSSLLLGCVIGCLQYADADVGFDEVYYFQRAVVALGLVGVIATGFLARKATALLYNVPHMIRLPFLLPVPHQGAFGGITLYKGCLPNRTSLLDLSLSSSLASFAAASSLIWASVGASSIPSATLDFRGMFLVPDQIFSYSTTFTWLVHQLSIATLSGEESGDINLAVSPLALAGILGLHFTAMGLLPLGILDGGRIITSIFGRDVQHVITACAFVGISIALLFKSPWLAVVWMIGSTPAVLDDWFQIDEVTQPSLIRTALGLGLVAAAVGTFLPASPLPLP
jgi:hypothetical protein